MSLNLLAMLASPTFVLAISSDYPEFVRTGRVIQSIS